MPSGCVSKPRKRKGSSKAPPDPASPSKIPKLRLHILPPSTASSLATVQIPPESESPTITPTTWAPSESGLPTQGQITQPEDDHTYMPDSDPVELYVSPPPFPEEDEESCLASQLKLATSHPQNIRATPPIRSGVKEKCRPPAANWIMSPLMLPASLAIMTAAMTAMIQICRRISESLPQLSARRRKSGMSQLRLKRVMRSWMEWS